MSVTKTVVEETATRPPSRHAVGDLPFAPSRDARVEHESTRLLFRFSPIACLAQLLILVVLGVVRWSDISEQWLLGFGLVTLVVLARYGLYRGFVSVAPQGNALGVWQAMYAMATLAAAAALGVLAAALVSDKPLAQQAMVAALLTLTATGAVATLAPHRWLLRGEVLLVLGPLAALLATSGQARSVVVALALAALMLLLVVMHSQVYRALRDALTVRFDNERLSATLADRESKLSETNSALQREAQDKARAEAAQAQALAKLRVHLENTPLGVIEWDLDGRITVWNAAAAGIFGWSANEAIGQRVRDLMIPDAELTHFLDVQRDVMAGRGVPRVVHEHSVKSGARIFCEWSYTPFASEGGIVSGAAAMVQDVTERVNTERTINYMAHHDALTGLPNRRLLADRLNQAIAQARRSARHVGLLFVDLDRFKWVNDTLGHEAGDTLLREVAQRLRVTVREVDTVSREGGDEFVIVLPELDRPESAQLVARKIQRALDTPLALAGQDLRISASIGISHYPGDAHDAAGLLKHADSAMYQAKEVGRNTVRFFTSDLNALLEKRVAVETRLRRGIDEGCFVLRYAPMAQVASGRIVGFEALVRWREPDADRDTLPTDLLDSAEELNLIGTVDEWALREAGHQLAAWQQARAPHARIALNLSAKQWGSRKLLAMITRVLRECGADPHALTLEVAEAALLRNLERSSDMLEQLAQSGVSVCIDDFGLGYASLGQLNRLAATSIKIDASYVEQLPGDAESRAVIESIASLGKRLHRSVIAAGVTRREQLEFLKHAHCDIYQGDLLSPPLTADAALRFAGNLPESQ